MQRITTRLVIVATTPDHLRAELASSNHLASLLQCTIPKGWPPGEYDEPAQRFFLERMLQGGAEVVGWYGWYGMLKQNVDPTVPLIATGGFFGPPSESGTVEIGYSVVADWQSRGYATELMQELVDFAFSDSRVRRIIAHTTLDNIASCKVLKRLQFNHSPGSPEASQIEFELLRYGVPA
jgi:RimJ/RimL family protein N-acetyltransferase